MVEQVGVTLRGQTGRLDGCVEGAMRQIVEQGNGLVVGGGGLRR